MYIFNSKRSRFLLALFICIILPILFVYCIAFLKILHGDAGIVCGTSGTVSGCLPMQEAGNRFGALLVLVVASAGVAVILPTLLIWAVIEVVYSIFHKEDRVN